MRKLYLQNDGSVCLYYVDGISTEGDRSAEYSYSVDSMAVGEINCIEGFTKNGNVIYSVADRDLHSASICAMDMDSLTSRSADSVQITANELLSTVKIINVDKNGCVFTEVYERINASTVAGEYTVRKYVSGNCQGIASIDLKQYYFVPYDMLEVSEDGELYQIICYKDKVEIVKKAFVETANFVSEIDNIKKETLALEAEMDNINTVAAIVNAPNNISTTRENAQNCCLLNWTYAANNAVNPNPTNVTTPDYLSSASKPSTQMGIPYCWGGFDGLNTSSSSSWSNFIDAMNKSKFAGNINTSTSGYKSGTAGLDCSGFISSTAGFSYKLSTTDLASSTYSKEVTDGRNLYDIYVKSGKHVLYYVGMVGDDYATREATTTGDDKTKLYTRTEAELSSYSLRRLNGW